LPKSTHGDVLDAVLAHVTPLPMEAIASTSPVSSRRWSLPGRSKAAKPGFKTISEEDWLKLSGQGD
jgi:hypothetical protein